MPDAAELAAVLRSHPGTLVLTGAGMSTDSGIPDYRGADGRRRVAHEHTAALAECAERLIDAGVLYADDTPVYQMREERMAGAVRTLLECIGEDPDREGLARTPLRFAKTLLPATNLLLENLQTHSHHPYLAN